MENWSDGYSYEYYIHSLDVLDYYRKKSDFDHEYEYDECEEKSYGMMFDFPKENQYGKCENSTSGEFSL